jgi:NADPH:quinone reductase-like Zn-dependent oxidoreductase
LVGVKAVVLSRYGPPGGARLGEVATPIPAGDAVLVRVCAAGVNRADLDVLKGFPAFARVATGMRGPRNQRLGSDLAGRVEAIGEDVTRFRVGDEVFGDLTTHGLGAFAEFACAPERAFAPKPAGLSFEEAAAVPWAGVLALQALRGRRPLPRDAKVLVNGASGSVGPFAVQIAKALGAEVTGVASTDKLEFVRSLGADHVIDYRREQFTENGRRYDRIIDVACHHSIVACRRSLRPNGVHVWIGGSMATFLQAVVVGPVMSLAGSRSAGVMWWWRPFKQDDVADLVDLIEAGTVKPVIDRTYPLGEVAEALRYVDDGHARGKVVVVT